MRTTLCYSADIFVDISNKEVLNKEVDPSLGAFIELKVIVRPCSPMLHMEEMLPMLYIASLLLLDVREGVSVVYVRTSYTFNYVPVSSQLTILPADHVDQGRFISLWHDLVNQNCVPAVVTIYVLRAL